ncbi:hypothetical protein Salat_1042200 [Sesamum alatum]|uniref:Uncharacterized protein n=1 Tax=Sesamum alatum TaxID=300844 RepID=A0AAE2CSE8_9LAMI|nr:hypothetical protein Salat_1042200 [Sesamum alatum]
MVKFSKYLLTNAFDKSLQKEEEVKKMLPHSISLEDDLDDGATQVVVSALPRTSVKFVSKLFDFLIDHLHIVSRKNETRRYRIVRSKIRTSRTILYCRQKLRKRDTSGFCK